MASAARTPERLWSGVGGEVPMVGNAAEIPVVVSLELGIDDHAAGIRPDEDERWRAEAGRSLKGPDCPRACSRPR